MSVNLNLQGLSGYDFSGIIEKMVQVYRMPENQMQEQQSKLKVQKSAWQDINTRLAAVNDALENLRKASTWTAAQAVSSNQSLLTATAGTGAIRGVYNIQINNSARAQTIASAVQAVASPTAATALNAGDFSITVGGSTKTISVAAGDSLSAIASSINNAQAGVTASVIQVSGGYQLAIAANQTGVANAAALANLNGGTLLQDLGLAAPDNTLNESQTALDANLTINGISNITSPTNSVTTAIPGVTLNLNGSDAGASTITLTVSDDANVAKEAVKNFITQYNSAMDLIESKLSFNSDKKKAGELMGDPVLQSIQRRLRTMVTGNLNNPTGPYLSLSSIGIKTSAADFGKDASLTMDEAKFSQALQANSQSVANLFGTPSGGVYPSTAAATAQGLANIVKSYLYPLVSFGGSLNQMQSSLDERIKDVGTQIQDFEKRVTQYQLSLQRKFSSLESLLSQLNSQGSWLSSQINAMNSSSKDS